MDNAPIVINNSCNKGGGGREGGGASCNKLHGAICNINKFINFVELVRPKKATPYTD